MIHSQPKLWFRNMPIDARDQALLAAAPVNFVQFGSQSYLRKLVSLNCIDKRVRG